MMYQRTKDNDCTCYFCKNHICTVNAEGTRCLHPLCEKNISEMHRKRAIESFKLGWDLSDTWLKCPYNDKQIEKMLIKNDI